MFKYSFSSGSFASKPNIERIEMKTVVGKSGVRTVVLGETPTRANSDDGKPRELEVASDGNNVYLHIHSPGNLGNGWAITVSEHDLMSALKSRA